MDRANAWYAERPWPVGANFVPSTAINQVEMWQPETFDPKTIDRELGWAAAIGMNNMRVFLHDIPWKEDAEGFCQRINEYLDIADRHGISTLFVIFDGVWNPTPKAGLQPEPRPGVHNSGWVQSPGAAILGDTSRHGELESYVKGVLSRFRDDPRIYGWDLFNEPDNVQKSKFADALSAGDKHDRACDLLVAAFRWAREINPSQPLTAGVWAQRDWLSKPKRIDTISLENSDLVSFHNYDGARLARKRILALVESINRPMLCTEYMARGAGSTFEGVLTVLHEHRIGAYNWGLVDGKSQTIYPWNSWQKPYDEEPKPWFHDVFRRDGTPYQQDEAELISRLSNAANPSKETAPSGALGPAEILEGLRAHDRALCIKSGWIRDPYIVRVPGGAYYLTGTTPVASDPRSTLDPYNTGLGGASLVGWKARIWRSKDLAEWEPLGAPFTLRDGVWAAAKPERFDQTPRREWRLWAPEMHWTGKQWVIVHTSPSPVAGANLCLTDGAELRGPWTSPMGEAIARRHDPSLFEDDNGQWWMIWGATKIAPLKADFSALDGEPIAIGPSGEYRKMGHEGCFIRKLGSKYVLFGTGWSTGKMRRGSYNLYYAVADEVTGPYGPRKFAGRFLGHGTIFQDGAGRWWCTAFYNANVPPVDDEEIIARDLRATAQTINEQGTTIVPIEVSFAPNGEPIIRAKDPRYANPGPDEAQEFDAIAVAEASP